VIAQIISWVSNNLKRVDEEYPKGFQRSPAARQLRPINALALSVILHLGYGCRGSFTTTAVSNTGTLTDDEKHRLYSAALAVSESPLDSEVFKEVGRKIGIFDATGQPNEHYMAFVAQHVNWGTNPGNAQFFRKINTREKAREYINQRLPR